MSNVDSIHAAFVSSKDRESKNGMGDSKVLTVFTPTWNRAHLLPRLYESLKRQTCMDFIWLVVDDGSTDETHALIQGWIRDCILPIHYVYQENGGKMRAHNRGVRECQTELFMCLDSDDYLSDDCVERICHHWKRFQGNDFVCGMVAYKKIGIASSRFPNVELSTLYDLYKIYEGETTLVFRTDVLLNYPFPEIEGEKFIGEGVVYDRLGQKYKFAVVPEYWMLCEYQEDGLTGNALKVLAQNPRGWTLNARQKYELHGRGIGARLKWMSTYICASLFAGYSLSKIVDDAPDKPFCVLCLPLGWLQKKKNQRKLER